LRTWYGLEVQGSPGDEETILAWIWELDPLGVEEKAEGLWVAFSGSPWPDGLEPSLSAAIDDPASIRRFQIEDEDWSVTWKAAWKPVALGSTLLIVPAWWKDPVDSTRNIVWIDPGRAFGTGTHESTILAWESLESLLISGDASGLLLDVGTGTGVLSLGALALNSNLRALGTERDPQAMSSLSANLALNAQADRFQTVLASDIPLKSGAAQIGVVNLTAAEHDAVRHEVVRVLAPGARLIVSGVLVEQETQQAAIWSSCGFRRESRRHQGEWVSLTLVAPPK
jgi:ribosomal protein L11 methyltransferase